MVFTCFHLRIFCAPRLNVKTGIVSHAGQQRDTNFGGRDCRSPWSVEGIFCTEGAMGHVKGNHVPDFASMSTRLPGVANHIAYPTINLNFALTLPVSPRHMSLYDARAMMLIVTVCHW